MGVLKGRLVLFIFSFALVVFIDSVRADVVVRSDLKDQDSTTTISLDFTNADISDVLKAIARSSGINIVAGDQVSGKVTVRMMNVSIEDALRTVLSSCGYSFIEEGNVIRVIKMPEGLVGVDNRTPQVLIESRIVEVTLGENNEEGVNWNLLAKKINGDLKVSGSIDLNIGDKGLLLNIYNSDAEAILNFLSQKSKTNVLSAPKILALDGNEARILIGEKVAYQQTFGQVTAGVASSTVKFEDVGIKLYVTPHIRSEETIILDVLVEVSSVKEWRTISNGDEIPIISTKQADSRVIVKNNSTIVIGGLIGEDRVESIWKVPILGDIPLIKYLFRRKHLETTRKELSIFITPRIVKLVEAAVIGD